MAVNLCEGKDRSVQAIDKAAWILCERDVITRVRWLPTATQREGETCAEAHLGQIILQTSSVLKTYDQHKEARTLCYSDMRQHKPGEKCPTPVRQAYRLAAVEMDPICLDWFKPVQSRFGSGLVRFHRPNRN